MVLIRQRAPASRGHPLRHTPAPTQHSRAWRTLCSQGLFQIRLLQPIFGKQGGSCLAGVDPGRASRCLPGPGSAGLAPTPPCSQQPCPLEQVPACPWLSHPRVSWPHCGCAGQCRSLWQSLGAAEMPGFVSSGSLTAVHERFQMALGSWHQLCCRIQGKAGRGGKWCPSSPKCGGLALCSQHP